METVILVIHLILATALVGVVLIQRSEGGGLGMGGGGGGGGGGFMSGRAAANMLTRTTAMLAVGFMCTSLLLAFIKSNSDDGKSILDQPIPAITEPAVPAEPSVPVVE